MKVVAELPRLVKIQNLTVNFLNLYFKNYWRDYCLPWLPLLPFLLLTASSKLGAGRLRDPLDFSGGDFAFVLVVLLAVVLLVVVIKIQATSYKRRQFIKSRAHAR